MLKNLTLSALALTTMFTQAATNNQQSETVNFATIAKSCVDIDLATWKHPTRAALIERSFKIHKIQMCNDGKYPVFYGQSEFDPRSTQTKDYFIPLYQNVLKANGHWPYSIVFKPDHLVVSVKPTKEKGAEGLFLKEENYIEPQ